jgi:hypothetical protein
VTRGAGNRSTSLTRLAALALLGALSVSGCSHPSPGAVTLTETTPHGAAARACAAVVAAAPGRVAGQERRKLSPSSRYAAAWGNPAIVLTCSGERPQALTQASPCYRVNGVDWLATQHGRVVDPSAPLSGDLTFTTVGRSAYVQVVVPDAYQPTADALVDLTPAVKVGTTATRPCV